jgi:hypothetical protein
VEEPMDVPNQLYIDGRWRPASEGIEAYTVAKYVNIQL